MQKKRALSNKINGLLPGLPKLLVLNLKFNLFSIFLGHFLLLMINHAIEEKLIMMKYYLIYPQLCPQLKY